MELNYMITQKQGPFSSQLDCGARALDLRPYFDNGRLVMHHGPAKVDHDFKDALLNVKGWVAQHLGELVVIYISHCDGGSDVDRRACADKTAEAVEFAGIAVLDCAKLGSMTVSDAMEQGHLGGTGGSLVVINEGCVVENYDPSIKCYGDIIVDDVGKPNSTMNASRLALLAVAPNRTSGPSGEFVSGRGDEPNGYYVCYGTGAQKAFTDLWTYMEKTCNTEEPPHADDGKLWTAQAHWQYDPSSISQGEMHHSCITADESAAGVNQQLAARIRSGSFKHLNFVEVDNVCDSGPELLQALRAHVAAASAAASPARAHEAPVII